MITDGRDIDKIEEILDNHAEYYIRETMKFFQENGESPALSKNNSGDLTAKQALYNLLVEAVMGAIGEDEDEWYLIPKEYGFKKGTKDMSAHRATRNQLRAEIRTQQLEVLTRLFNIDGSK